MARYPEVLPLPAIATALAALLLTSACSTSREPSQADLKAQWEARNIPPTNAKADILAFMRTYLNNPDGVRGAMISQPFRKTLPADPADRYLICVRYDARRSSGNYAGPKTGAVTFVSGRLDVFYDNPREAAEALCKEAAYQPFPELEHLKR